mgnify:CR=1 FL=1
MSIKKHNEPRACRHSETLGMDAVFLDWGDAGGLGIVRTISELRLIYGGACIHLGYCPNRYWASSYKKDLDEWLIATIMNAQAGYGLLVEYRWQNLT